MYLLLKEVISISDASKNKNVSRAGIVAFIISLMMTMLIPDSVLELVFNSYSLVGAILAAGIQPILLMVLAKDIKNKVTKGFIFFIAAALGTVAAGQLAVAYPVGWTGEVINWLEFGAGILFIIGIVLVIQGTGKSSGKKNVSSVTDVDDDDDDDDAESPSARKKEVRKLYKQFLKDQKEFSKLFGRFHKKYRDLRDNHPATNPLDPAATAILMVLRGLHDGLINYSDRINEINNNFAQDNAITKFRFKRRRYEKKLAQYLTDYTNWRTELTDINDELPPAGGGYGQAFPE